MYLRWIQPASPSARGAFIPTCRKGVSGSVITRSPWLQQHQDSEQETDTDSPSTNRVLIIYCYSFPGAFIVLGRQYRKADSIM